MKDINSERGAPSCLFDAKKKTPFSYCTTFSTVHNQTVFSATSGGLHPDLGHTVRLPLPQVLRRARQVHQGVRQDGVGPH